MTPSEFGLTPKSNIDNKSTFNGSFDYSVIQIEFMADSNTLNTETVTPKGNGINQFPPSHA